MKKGGYKIIDFGGSTLSSTPVTKTGILASLKDNYGKVVLLTGVVIGDNAMDDCFSTPLSDGDDGFKLNAYDGYIAVTKAGAVTYTVASSEELAEDVSDLQSDVLDLQTDVSTTRQMLAIVENGDTCTHTGGISAGQYVAWKGNLYTADSAISVEDTLTSSGESKNLTAVSDGGLNDLKTSIMFDTETVSGITITANSYVEKTITTNWGKIPKLVFVQMASITSIYVLTVYDITANSFKVRFSCGANVTDASVDIDYIAIFK